MHIRKRLTYANVMSSLAVFLILGGATAIAAGLAKNSVGAKQLKKNAVTTAKIKNGAVTTAKLQNGAVTGDKVNLSSLGKVPNAAHADSAGSANTANSAKTAESANTANSAGTASNANAVAGSTIRKFSYASSETAAETAILSLGGLTLTAGCNLGVTKLTATTSVDGALIHAGGAYGFPNTFYGENDDFDISEPFNVLAEASDSVQGTLTYVTPSGEVVTAVFQAEQEGLSEEETDCVISGHAIG